MYIYIYIHIPVYMYTYLSTYLNKQTEARPTLNMLPLPLAVDLLKNLPVVH